MGDNWLLDKLKGLKGLINVEFNSPIISINLTKKDSDNITEYNPESKVLDLNLQAFSKDQKKQIKPIIAEYIARGNKLLFTDTSDLLYKLYNYMYQKKHLQLLIFFSNILSIDDYRALESSLFLRDEFNKGNNVSKLKHDIRQAYGIRGNTICNLCTAGYFENFFIPLYNQEKEKFNTLYEMIIQHSLIAVFVHGNMKKEEITEQIKNKLYLSKRYGIKFIHVHGIGQSNIQTIKECIEENKKFFDFFEKNIFESNGIIIVELLIKDKKDNSY